MPDIWLLHSLHKKGAGDLPVAGVSSFSKSTISNQQFFPGQAHPADSAPPSSKCDAKACLQLAGLMNDDF